MTATVVREPSLRLDQRPHGYSWNCQLCNAGRVRSDLVDAIHEWADHYRVEHGEDS